MRRAGGGFVVHHYWQRPSQGSHPGDTAINSLARSTANAANCPLFFSLVQRPPKISVTLDKSEPIGQSDFRMGEKQVIQSKKKHKKPKPIPNVPPIADRRFFSRMHLACRAHARAVACRNSASSVRWTHWTRAAIVSFSLASLR